jgi:hypothetical protein
MMKKEGKPKTLKNVISFDKFDLIKKMEAEAVGFNLYHFNEVIEAGKKLKEQ